MMASRSAIKFDLASDLENVGQCHHINIAVSQVLYDRFLPNIHRNDVTATSNKKFISAELENIRSGHYQKKQYILIIYERF